MAETAYGFNTRFGDKKGTNPEELIAATNSACFTMALSNALAQAGHAPDAVDTRADVDLSMDGGTIISQIRLQTKADWKSVVKGKSASVHVDLACRRPIKKTHTVHHDLTHSTQYKHSPYTIPTR